MTNSAAVVKRIGIKLQPPQVLIEYHRQSQCRVRRIHISNDLAKKGPEEVVRLLKVKYHTLLYGAVSQEKLTQIVRQLLPDVQSKEPLSGSSAADSSDTAPSTATIKFGRGMPLGADLDPLKDLTEIDLNKVSEYENIRAKEAMDQIFEKKRLKPGDEGYVWNKEVDFNPTEDNDWDED